MRLERIIAIIMLLLQRDKISGKQLAEMFEVSIRTIYRDIKTINQAGIPIVTICGNSGGISIMKEYKVEKGIFTIKDISSILIGLRFASDAISKEEIASTLAKIKSFIPEDRQNEITLKTDQISFDLSSWIGAQDVYDKVETIRTAQKRQNIVSFIYLSAKDEKTARQVEPHRLSFKDNSWYLQGFCLSKQQFRLFKLSRVSQLKIKNDNFTSREIPPAFQNFTNAMSRKTVKITLLFENSILDRILDHCGEANITHIGDDKSRAVFDFVEDDYGYGILLSFGDKCECIETKRIRQELSRRLNNIIKIYAHNAKT